MKQVADALLEDLVAVRFEGPDARKFVQGQFTQDVRTLTREQALLGSNNNGQGRVQMVATLIEWGEDVVLLCPRAVLDSTLQRLRRFIIAAKVSFAPLGQALVALSQESAAALLGQPPPQTPGACAQSKGGVIVRYWGAEPRWLLVPSGPLSEQLRLQSSKADAAWHASDIRQGLPQVYPETQKSFVPQHLNLDHLDGVSFKKGCYVGQEVVARARLKGVPRRMFAYTATCAPPPPGSPVTCDGQEVGEVVDAVVAEFGCSLLAVVDSKLASAAGLRLEDTPLRTQPLPYG